MRKQNLLISLILGGCYGAKAMANADQRFVHTVDRGDTLSEIITAQMGKYYFFGPEEILKIYKNINPEIRNEHKIYVGQKIQHPSYNELKEFLENFFDEYKPEERRIGDLKNYLRSLPRIETEYKETFKTELAKVETPLEKTDREPSSGEDVEESAVDEKSQVNFSLGQRFLTLQGVNKSNQARFQALSDQYLDFKVGVTHRREQSEFGVSWNYSKLQFNQSDATSLATKSLNNHRLEVFYRRLMNNFSLGAFLNFGDGFTIQNTNGSVVLKKVRDLRPGLSADYKLFQSKKVKVGLGSRVSYSVVTQTQGTSAKGGMGYEGHLEFSFPRSFGEPGVKTYYREQHSENETFTQTEKETGILFFMNLEF